MATPGRKRLGEMLLEDGLISKEQLEEALSLQKKASERKFIGEMLVALGYLSDESLGLAISKKIGMKFVSFADGTIKLNYDQGLDKLVSEKFARDNFVLPISKTAQTITIVMWDPLDFVVIDNIKQIAGMELQILCSTKKDILEGIEKLYVQKGPFEEKSDKDKLDSDEDDGSPEDLDMIKSQAEEAPVVQLVNKMIQRAVKEQASDIHIDPQEERVSVRFRIDGVLYEIESPPKDMIAGIISRIKILSRLDIAEKRLPQDGGFMAKIEERDIDFRVATLPTIYGEKVVIRLLDKEQMNITLETIGLDEKQMAEVRDNIKKPNGLIFVTGPTGSGKTTMLYCVLNAIRSSKKNIMTIEDPVEYRIETVNQVHARPQIGLDFARTLRAFLRHDPDIIMVGEVRDLPTAEICVRAALVGRLVFSTVHTNDTVGTISRMLDFGIEPFLLATTLNMVVAQRLVRRLCPKCKVPVKLENKTLEQYDLKGADIYGAKGCKECHDRGYKGRMAIFEIMSVNAELKGMIERREDMVNIREYLRERNMKTLRGDGLDKVRQGLTSLEEVLTTTLGVS